MSVVAPLLADGTNVLTDDKSRLSYAIGMLTGHQWKQQNLDFDPDSTHAVSRTPWLAGQCCSRRNRRNRRLTPSKRNLPPKQQQQQIEQTAKNKSDGEAFLAKNKTQPGVVTLPDGLQYKVITEGDGEVPGDNNTVLFNFRGTLVDGTEFDNLARTGKPLELTVGRISIRGLSEALKLMKTGSKWQLFIPPELAYGQNGAPPRIPPDATLIMEVELLSVERPQPQPQPVPAPPSSANAPLTSDIIKVPSAEEMKKGAKIEIIKPEDVQKLQQSQTNAAN